jgi:hypothetical protein
MKRTKTTVSLRKLVCLNDRRHLGILKPYLGCACMESPNLDPILSEMHARQHQVYKGLLLCSRDAPAGESASDLRDHAPAAPL